MNTQPTQMFSGFEKKPLIPQGSQSQKKQKIIKKIVDFFSSMIKNKNFWIFTIIALFLILVFLYQKPTADFIVKEIKRSNELKEELNKSILDLRNQKWKVLKYHECMQKQLERMSHGLDVEKNYCDHLSPFSFIPEVYAESEPTKDPEMEEKLSTDDIPLVVGCVNTRDLSIKEPIEGKTGIKSCFYGQNWKAITLRGWSLEYYKKNDITLTDTLDLLAINSIECPHNLWICDGGSIGPFQINMIHKEEYAFAREIFNQPVPGGAEMLYERQMLWTLERFKKQQAEGGYCVGLSWEKRFKCLAKYHNGNNTIDWNGKKLKENYADVSFIMREYIESYVKDHNLFE